MVLGQRLGIRRRKRFRARADTRRQQVRIEPHIAVLDDLLCRRHIMVGDHGRPRLVEHHQRLARRRHHEIAGDDHVRGSRRRLARLDVVRIERESHMGENRSALLRQSRHVQRLRGLAVDVGRHGEHRSHRRHARAADAREHHVPRLMAQLRQGRLRKARQVEGRRAPLGIRLPVSARHRHEARAESFKTRVVRVAGGLVDLPLSPVFRFDRLHGQAVGLHRTVATALADRLVDEHAPGRRFHLPALDPPPLLRRAHLVIDQHGDARRVAQFDLDFFQLPAVEDARAFRQVAHAGIAGRIVRDDHDGLDALGLHLPRDLRHGLARLHLLAAGHRHGVVVEDLVRRIHLARDRCAYRQRAGMRICPVAQVYEHVRFGRERHLADPWRAFAAHLRMHVGASLRRERRHVVAADPRQRA